MRLLARLAGLITVVLAPTAAAHSLQSDDLPQVTRYAGDFAVSALDFFGPTGLTGRYITSACTPADYAYGQYACADVVLERGIEAATGIGAVRYRITQLTSNMRGDPSSGVVGVSFSGGLNEIRGFASTLPGSTRNAFVSGVFTDDRVRRNTGVGDANWDGALRYETFVPTELELSLIFNYRHSAPTGPDCPYTGRATCSTDWVVRSTNFTDITAVPEPSTYALLGTGLLTLSGIASRRRKRADA